MVSSSKIILFGVLITVALLSDCSSAQRRTSVPATRNTNTGGGLAYSHSSFCTVCSGSCNGYACCDGFHTQCGLSGGSCHCFGAP
ncbi:hypothetical protein Ocin01_12447 [Orchesella cincta]|uniref:Uncharacterized protein n=1 Tax=Orchesella cincta TaxID=48709 RepID=A0A1D2MN03_ORCCI|nr:hypothetical protein Ocin01_12447 [Orchesella cincta]